MTESPEMKQSQIRWQSDKLLSAAEWDILASIPGTGLIRINDFTLQPVGPYCCWDDHAEKWQQDQFSR